MRALTIVVLSIAAAGCGSSDAPPPPPNITLTGTIGPGPSEVRTEDLWGGVTPTSDGLRVIAHEVFDIHERTTGLLLESTINADGRWSLDLAKSQRWLVTVESADGHIALLMFGDKSVITLGRRGETRVDVGTLHLFGGKATSKVDLAKIDLDASRAVDGEVMAEENGFVGNAAEPADEAEKAVKDAEEQQSQQ